MKNQVKVTSTKQYQSSQGDYIGVEGKLVLVSSIDDGIIINNAMTYHKPIIISETEQIESGDKFYSNINHTINTYTDTSWRTNDKIKILALPENFSPKQLQAIVDGKMKDGDKVILECEKEWDSPCSSKCKEAILTGVDDICSDGCMQSKPVTIIKLNKSNHITLHKVEEKTYSQLQVNALLDQQTARTTALILNNDRIKKDWNRVFYKMKTAEEMINEYGVVNNNDSLDKKIAINYALEYGRQVAEAVKKECAEKVRIKEVDELLGKEWRTYYNIDRDSILSVDIEQFLK